jgi:hypothetical protein
MFIIENQFVRFGEGRNLFFFLEGNGSKIFRSCSLCSLSYSEDNASHVRWKLYQISWRWFCLDEPTRIILPRKVSPEENFTNTLLFTIPSIRSYTAQFIPDNNFTTDFASINFNFIHPYVPEATTFLEYYHIYESHIATCYPVKHA